MHISKQPNGKWRVIVQDDRRRRSAVVDTEREARRTGARLMIELGKQPKVEDCELGELMEMHVDTTDLATTTRADYTMLLAKMPDWLKAWKIANVTTMMIDQMYRRLLTEGWTPYRVRRLHEVMRPAFGLACRYGWVTVNPVLNAKQPPKPANTMTVPGSGDVIRLFTAADELSPAFGCAIRLAARTGMRRGELCGLQWADIDIDTGVLVIRRSISTTTDNAHEVTDGKTHRQGHRVIKLSDTTCADLKPHRARQAAFALQNGLSAPTWIFTHDLARPWRTDYVTKAFTRIRDDLGLPDVHLHTLRHYVATELIASGMDIRTVSGRLGHARTSTTLDIYADFMPARDAEAAEIMERRLGG